MHLERQRWTCAREYLCQCVFTCAGELLGGRGQQQLVRHVTRPGATGDAGFLVAALHPV